jgi:glycosyltransferase involved in cell wall biosynthesis
MKIGIDARTLEKKMTGIGRYLLDMLKCIPEVDTKNSYYLFSYRNIDIKNSRCVSVAPAPRFPSSKIYSPLWLLKVIPKQLKKYEIDIFFSPNFLAPPKKEASRWKSIIVVCDVFQKLGKRYIPFSYNVYLNSVLRHSIPQSDAIVTISQHSKQDIVQTYSVAPEKIHVIYPSANKRFNAEQIDAMRRKEVTERYKLPQQFILYVGVVEVRKNIIGITRIADILKRQGVTVPIVLIGRNGFGFNKIMNEVSKRNNIQYVDYVGEEFLADIYKLASVFVFPSYYEGFGIPPLEAMQSGVPVVTSNTSSLPEVVGEAGSMFHPDDADGFANEIIRLLEDGQYHRSRSEGGIAQARRFNAHDSAASLVQLFSRVGS